MASTTMHPNTVKAFAANSKLVALARDWIADCEWRDDINADELSELEVARGVAMHYDGGIAAFRGDC